MFGASSFGLNSLLSLSGGVCCVCSWIAGHEARPFLSFITFICGCYLLDIQLTRGSSGHQHKKWKMLIVSLRILIRRNRNKVHKKISGDKPGKVGMLTMLYSFCRFYSTRNTQAVLNYSLSQRSSPSRKENTWTNKRYNFRCGNTLWNTLQYKEEVVAMLLFAYSYHIKKSLIVKGFFGSERQEILHCFCFLYIKRLYNLYWMIKCDKVHILYDSMYPWKIHNICQVHNNCHYFHNHHYWICYVNPTTIITTLISHPYPRPHLR